ncbi:MAG TPA: diaminopimelate epimerase [Bryobacteraceae bacterium]|nr:diaminopimelate epimerase [Bryobacteraceae bacterium]
MKIPFTKAHGARNDFLLSWRDQLPAQISDYAAAARAICDRNTGVGADGWLLISAPGVVPGSSQDADDGEIELWNSDGSRSEISGNGTRCAAALLVSLFPTDATGRARNVVRIATGAGAKSLRLLDRHGNKFSFEMNLGRPKIEELRAKIEGHDATVLNVGNPQCAIFVKDFDFDWAALGARVGRLARFPNGANVSFVKVSDRHTLETRFVERGAGVTMSSGTGATGAAASAHARDMVESPARVHTPAGPLNLRWERHEILLAGPAEIVASGEFYWEG